jgi:hypothetical protein
MERVPTTLLLIAMLALTATCLFGKLTPAGLILLYGGWLFLLQHVGRRLLDQSRRQQQPVPVPIQRPQPQRREHLR